MCCLFFVVCCLFYVVSCLLLRFLHCCAAKQNRSFFSLVWGLKSPSKEKKDKQKAYLKKTLCPQPKPLVWGQLRRGPGKVTVAARLSHRKGAKAPLGGGYKEGCPATTLSGEAFGREPGLARQTFVPQK